MGSRLLSLAVLLAVGPLCSMAWGVASGNPKWWQNTVIYEIYPQSFYDSDGDGLGDLTGITAKADYLRELGVGAVWINPFYESPQKDNGYDISDFRKIDPKFGTMDDFDKMMDALRWERNIELIMDFVPNHTSDQHEWFKKSVKKEDPYTDYYVWKDPKEWKNGKPIPPSNWESIFALGQPSSAWQWNDERQQFYYHAFMPEQPDLNFRSPNVMEELKGVLSFWMDKGVKGFRFDAVPHLIEDGEFKDEHGSHERTQNLPETYKIIEEFRDFIDVYSEEHSQEIFLTTEGYATPEETIRYYGENGQPGAHFPFNFILLTDVDSETNAPSLKNTIDNYLKRLNSQQFPNWVSGNHDWPRIPSRMGASSATDIVNTLNLLLPGTSTVYMGDELGMDTYWNMDKKQCPAGVADDYRTPSRTPFHWSTEKNAGFTKNDKPWVPLSPEYYLINYEYENKMSSRGPQVSHLQNFKKLRSLKKLDAFTKGSYESYAINDQVFAFIRQDSKIMYLAIINLSKSFSDSFDLKKAIPELKDATNLSMEMRSVNLVEDCPSTVSCFRKFFNSTWNMPPKSAAVLSFKTPVPPRQVSSSHQGSVKSSVLSLNLRQIFPQTSKLQLFRELMDMETQKAPTESYNTYKLNEDVFAFVKERQRLVYVAVINLNLIASKSINLLDAIPDLKKTPRNNVELKSNRVFTQCAMTSDCFSNFLEEDWKFPPKSAVILSFRKPNGVKLNFNNNDNSDDDNDSDDTSSTDLNNANEIDSESETEITTVHVVSGGRGGGAGGAGGRRGGAGGRGGGAGGRGGGAGGAGGRGRFWDDDDN